MVDDSIPKEIFNVFDRDVFNGVLQNTMAAHEMLKFTAREQCSENLTFLYKVEKLQTLIDQLSELMKSINEFYIVDDAPYQINIDGATARSITRSLKNARTTILPPLRHMFDKVQREIQDLLYMDVYPRFVQFKLSQSASRALAEDKQSIYYQGLGDCFCLTAPALPDNPIVYASDGFIRVTGYERKEIMNRNCRFLQGKYTEQNAVKGLRSGIRNRTETVQLLLNYRKDGTPFWNLLYVTPLIDATGNCAFFLGGQINLSTNIHDKLDILQVLSYTAKVKPKPESEYAEPAPNLHQLTRSPGFGRLRIFDNIRAALSSNSDALVDPNQEIGETGMEGEMLKAMQELDLREQMETFYNAYRRYMVLRHDDLKVLFHSPNLLNTDSAVAPPSPPPSSGCSSPPASPHSPLNPDKSFQAVEEQQQPRVIAGMDVFKVLLDISMNPKSVKATRSLVRKALKEGNAVSTRIDVLPPSTPRNNPYGSRRQVDSRDSGFSYGTSNGSASGESFASLEDCEKINIHWTPVKDENGVSGLVVVILG